MTKRKHQQHTLREIAAALKLPPVSVAFNDRLNAAAKAGERMAIEREGAPKQRFIVEHGSSCYYVVDTVTGTAVASYPYRKELDRGQAYNKAKWDMQERNEGTK